MGHLLKMGSVSVLGPSFSVVVVAISLIAMVGSGLTFMRVGVIGAAGYEMMIATTAAETIGVQFNTPEFNESVLVLCGFGMAFASIPYFISTPIELMIMDKAAAKAGGKAKDKPSFIPYLGKAAMMGLMGSFAVSYLASPINWVAFLTAAAVVILIIKRVAKTGKKGLVDWCITIAMLCGMTVAQIVSMLIA